MSPPGQRQLISSVSCFVTPNQKKPYQILIERLWATASVQAPATHCAVPRTSGAGNSLVAAHLCLRGQRQRMSPHGNGVGRAQEGNSVADRRPCFRCARHCGVCEVRGWLDRELYKSQKKYHQSGLLPARPHDGCKQNRQGKCGMVVSSKSTTATRIRN